jgi:hypothetical protein
MRGWVCRLQLLLVLAAHSFSGPSPAGLSQIGDSPNLEGQVPVFISHMNRVARLYPHALGSNFDASYDSQSLSEFCGAVKVNDRLIGCLFYSYVT